MNKGNVEVVDHEKKESNPFAVHTQWLIKMSYPLTDEAVIVGFYYFWRHRNEIFRQYYKRFQPKDRKVLKQRAWICQQYSKRYLGGGTLELWYMHFIISMNFTVPNEPLVELQQSQLGPMLQRIYQTHDPNFQEPTFPQDDHKQEQSKNRKKGFFNFLKNIFSLSHKKEEKDEVHLGLVQECIPLKSKQP